MGLHEAAIGAQSLAEEISGGRITDTADLYGGMPVDYDHIVGHICHSWHGLWLTDDEDDAITQEQFVDWGDSIPNWTGEFHVPEYLTVEEIDLRPPGLPDHWCNTKAMTDALMSCHDQLLALSKLIHENYVLPPLPKLTTAFAEGIITLVWSWHVKYIPTDLITQLTDDQINSLRCIIPSWGFGGNYQIVPVSTRFGSYDPYAAQT